MPVNVSPSSGLPSNTSRTHRRSPTEFSFKRLTPDQQQKIEATLEGAAQENFNDSRNVSTLPDHRFEDLGDPSKRPDISTRHRRTQSSIPNFTSGSLQSDEKRIKMSDHDLNSDNLVVAGVSEQDNNYLDVVRVLNSQGKYPVKRTEIPKDQYKSCLQTGRKKHLFHAALKTALIGPVILNSLAFGLVDLVIQPQKYSNYKKLEELKKTLKKLETDLGNNFATLSSDVENAIKDIREKSKKHNDLYGKFNDVSKKIKAYDVSNPKKAIEKLLLKTLRGWLIDRLVLEKKESKNTAIEKLCSKNKVKELIKKHDQLIAAIKDCRDNINRTNSEIRKRYLRPRKFTINGIRLNWTQAKYIKLSLSDINQKSYIQPSIPLEPIKMQLKTARTSLHEALEAKKTLKQVNTLTI